MTKLSAVIYTDGSARPNPGTFSGWGNYGYTYKESVTYEKPSDTRGLKVTQEVVVNRDGKPAEPVKLSEFQAWGGLEGIADNNEGEIQGITAAINYACDWGVKNLDIRSDSQLALKGASEWMPKWEARGWKKSNGGDVPYQEYWKALKAAKVRAADINIKWTWVKGHSGNVGNDKADDCAKKGGSLAGIGRYEPVFETILEESSEGVAVKPKVKKVKVPPYSRLLMHSKWYFSTNTGAQQSKDGRNIYLLGIHSENDLYGKRVSDAANSVVFLKEEEKVLELVRAKQDDYADEYVIPVYGRLDSIRSSKNYAELFREGTDYLQRGITTPTLSTTSGVLLTEPASPARLAFIGLEALDHLTSRLEEYIAKDAKSEMGIVDITDRFYESTTDSKGKVKLSPTKEIVDNAKFLNVKADWKSGKRTGSKEVVLTIGLDAPTKNMLNAMSKETPSIKVITWPESKQTIRYAVIVETDKDVALFASTYSNLCLV